MKRLMKAFFSASVNLSYGFDDDVYKSLAEMGRIYHLSETRAKRTEDEAIGKLRKEIKHSL